MIVQHIYHSGFMITLENSVLLFDWYKRELPAIPEDKKLFVFCSHAHEDHYSPMIWDLQKDHPGTVYVLDAGIPDAVRHAEAEVLTVQPRQEYFLGNTNVKADFAAGSGGTGLRILTLESTDMGVAFYVETEGRRIYHAGDLNVWFWNDEPMEDNIASEKKCREEMQYLAEILRRDMAGAGGFADMAAETGKQEAVSGEVHKKESVLPGADEQDSFSLRSEGVRTADGSPVIDAACVPLDFRLEEYAPKCIADFMQDLGAKYVFPMHYWGRKEEVKKYLADDPLRKYAADLHFDDIMEI